MFKKNSRYQNTSGFSGDSDFQGILPRTITTLEGVIEHTVREGERLDQLARRYYNDERLWWRILDANPELLYGGDLVIDRQSVEAPRDGLSSLVGDIILIPSAR